MTRSKMFLLAIVVGRVEYLHVYGKFREINIPWIRYRRFLQITGRASSRFFVDSVFSFELGVFKFKLVDCLISDLILKWLNQYILLLFSAKFQGL